MHAPPGIFCRLKLTIAVIFTKNSSYVRVSMTGCLRFAPVLFAEYQEQWSRLKSKGVGQCEI